MQVIVVLRTDGIGGDLMRRNEEGNWPDRASPLEVALVVQSIGMTIALAQLYQRTPLAQG